MSRNIPKWIVHELTHEACHFHLILLMYEFLIPLTELFAIILIAAQITGIEHQHLS